MRSRRDTRTTRCGAPAHCTLTNVPDALGTRDRYLMRTRCIRSPVSSALRFRSASAICNRRRDRLAASRNMSHPLAVYETRKESGRFPPELRSARITTSELRESTGSGARPSGHGTQPTISQSESVHSLHVPPRVGPRTQVIALRCAHWLMHLGVVHLGLGTPPMMSPEPERLAAESDGQFSHV